MLKLIFCLIFVVCKSESARILGVFPTPSISHQVVFRPLMLELAKRGHDVTVITTDPEFPKGQSPQNLNEIDLHNISYKAISSFIDEHPHVSDRVQFIENVYRLLTDVFEEQLKSYEVQKLLQDHKQFDLLFVEACVRPTLIFSHIYDAPVIAISSLGGIFLTYELVAADTHPIIYPNPMHRRYYNLTFWDKIEKLYYHYAFDQSFREHEHYENEMLRKIFGPSVPSLDDLRKNVQMLFLNTNPLWDFNRPVPPNVVYLGGMHQKPERELPEEWKTYLDSSKNGVVYVSFGSNMKPSLLPQDKIKIFIDVFSKLPYNVLWKWDKDELEGRPKNVIISKWLPQSDLLRHPNIKLFITQGGLQSTDESISAGVPLIGMPILGDQWMNVENYVKFKIGKKLSITSFTEDELKEAIDTIINDESYRKNIIKLRNIFSDQPFTPIERGVWWTEYVLRHRGAAHLRAPALDISWTEYYELELLAILIITAGTAVAFLLLITCCLYSKAKQHFISKRKSD